MPKIDQTSFRFDANLCPAVWFKWPVSKLAYHCLSFRDLPMHAVAFAPGSHVARLGLCGNPVPDVTMPAAEIELVPSRAAASSLLLASAKYLSISSQALKAYILVVAVPAENFGHETRRSICHAALGLLGMAKIIFVSAPTAIALAVCRDAVPHVIVDVGWASTRIIIKACVVAVAEVGLRDVGNALVISFEAALPDTDQADAIRSCACFFRRKDRKDVEGRIGTEDSYGGLTDIHGHEIVGGTDRWKAPEVLFNILDGMFGYPLLDSRFICCSATSSKRIAT
jgi:hypothetical protein